MRVWLLQTGEVLPTQPGVRRMRTALLAEELVRRGHTVWWWTSAFEHQTKRMVFDSDAVISLSPDLVLRVLRGIGYRGNVSLARYVDHRVVAHKFRRQARGERPPDVIVASLPCHQLAYQAVEYGWRTGVPVLVDVRDLWPDIFLGQLGAGALKRCARLLLWQDFARTRSLFRKAAGVVAVSEGYLNWALGKAARLRSERDAVFFLGYQPLESSAALRHEELPPWLKGRTDAKLFVFVGTFGVSYELELVLEAARRLSSAGVKDVAFVIAGTGDQAASLTQAAAALPSVVLPGWIDAPQIRTLLANGYAGLVPCRSADNTLPNKPFEYLAAGLPLISSLQGEMQTLIDQYDLGMTYQPGDVDGLCGAIKALALDPARRERMSMNARRFAATLGNADVIYRAYAAHIEQVGGRHGRARDEKRNGADAP